MTYITLEEKLEELVDENPEEPISLPLEMLASISGSTSLAYFLDTSPHAAKDVIDLYTLEKATGFYVELTRTTSGDIKKTFYVTFDGIPYKVFINLDNSDFFNHKKMEEDMREHLDEVSQGDLVVCAYSTYLVKNISDLLEAGFERVHWDAVLPEGSLLTVLNTVKVENFWLVKVLHKEKPMWAFGVFFKYDYFDNRTNTNHFI